MGGRASRCLRPSSIPLGQTNYGLKGNSSKFFFLPFILSYHFIYFLSFIITNSFT